MCSTVLILCTCAVYTLCLVHAIRFSVGLRSRALSIILFIALTATVAIQIMSSCHVAYVKIGAGILAVLMFVLCLSCPVQPRI